MKIEVIFANLIDIRDIGEQALHIIDFAESRQFGKVKIFYGSIYANALDREIRKIRKNERNDSHRKHR
jgi:hypothetical protein